MHAYIVYQNIDRSKLFDGRLDSLIYRFVVAHIGSTIDTLDARMGFVDSRGNLG